MQIKKKIIKYFGFLIFLFFGIYFGVGFYLANTILKIDHSCGNHEGSLPNTWSVLVDSENLTVLSRKELRRKFDPTKYHLENWQEVYFPSRDKKIKISGWLFYYFQDRPIVIVVHGIFPNGKCKPESNLIASLLIKNKINALTIDLRNYGQSSIIGKYENLGLSEYKDVLGAFDFLKNLGFADNEIGLHGISLGAASVIFAAQNEPRIRAIWSDSSIAEFNMILKDEINRYGMPYIFGPTVSFAGKILTGIDPTKLSPSYSLTNSQNYFFTHGEKDQRVLPKHFNFIKKYVDQNNINADFWFVKDTYHVDAMLKYPDEYGLKMKNFFEKYLK